MILRADAQNEATLAWRCKPGAGENSEIPGANPAWRQGLAFDKDLKY